MKLWQTIRTAVVVSGLLASQAMAFQPGAIKVEVGGNVTQSVTADSMINAAIGSGAKAGQSVATIHDGTKVGGNVSQSVHAKHIINAAIGAKSMACQSIASIGNTPACNN